MDIYGRHRYIDFALESPESKIAIEIDGETYHNPSKVSENKYADDLLNRSSAASKKALDLYIKGQELFAKMML